MNLQLIVFSGLPGAGKTSVAEGAGHSLGIPVFAKDWLEGAALRSGALDAASPHLGSLGYELLTVLARRQLTLGQSAILDSVAGSLSIRRTWRDLAREFAAGWTVIECVCSDEQLHRQRLKDRRRGIPGWHELEWADVERVRGYYPAWDEDRLILDMTRSLEQNISTTIAHIKNSSYAANP